MKIFYFVRAHHFIISFMPQVLYCISVVIVHIFCCRCILKKKSKLGNNETAWQCSVWLQKFHWKWVWCKHLICTKHGKINMLAPSFIQTCGHIRRSLSGSSGKFKVLGVQQIAIGGLDKQLLTNFWVNTMGITKVGDYKSEVILINMRFCWLHCV